MEIFNIILCFLLLSPLAFPFIVLRIVIFCLSFYLKRKHSITLSVSKCGLIYFRAITLHLPANRGYAKNDEQKQDGKSDNRYTTITIDNLRLSSLYLDSACTSILTVYLSNITVHSPLEHGQQIKIGSLELPMEKIGTGFLDHLKENFSITLNRVVIVLKNFSYRVEKLLVTKSVIEQKSLKVEFNNVIFSDLSIPEVQIFSEMPEELSKQRILFIEQLLVSYVKSHNKNLQLNIVGDCFLQWNLEFHQNIVTLVSNIKKLIPMFKSQKERPVVPQTIKVAQKTPNPPLIFKLDLDGRLSIGAVVSENQTVCINTHSLDINSSFPGPKTIRSKLIRLDFDEHTILTCSMASVTHFPSPGITCLLDRKQNSCGMHLNDASNSLLSVEIETVNLIFPYKYNFAETFNEKFMGIIKWLKKYHQNPNRKLRKNRPIDFDMSFRINKFLLEVEDDPFETKLRNNYMLLKDEHNEQLKREQKMEDKINECKRTNLMLASPIYEELNRASLAKKNSDVYIQRSKKMYSIKEEEESRRVPLLRVVIEEADLKILADSSFHDHKDIKSMISNLDPKGQMPEDINFLTLWCRIISANLKNAEFRLRDFPLPVVVMKDLTVKGTVFGTEQFAVARAKRNCLVYVGRNTEPSLIERSMTPLKIYHNLQLRCTTANYTHGPCWEPVLQQVSLAFEDIVSASSDPSPSLTWWDKMRFIIHGQARLNCNQLSVKLHASNDPYNQTEMIELTLSRALIDWTSGRFKIKGDFDALLHTASRFDKCRFIHIPNFDVTATLQWNCLGNPHDHYSIMPCAPDKVPDYSSHHSHDSYRSFRSQSLNLSLNFETQFTSPTSSMNPDNMPSMLFFGSTIRWLENQKFIFVGVSRLTRRGVLFDNIKPRKPSLSRIFKEISVTVSLNRFQILYWSSVSKRHGIHIVSGELTHSSEHTLKLVNDTSDGLKHRQQADWQTVYMKSSLANVEVWLYNLVFEDLDEFNEFNPQTNMKNRQYFISFNRISYNKEAQAKNDDIEEFELSHGECVENLSTDMQSNNGEEHVPNHRLVIHDLKAAWTKENRDVVISIFDAFMSSQQLKRNLSTEAIKPIRKETPIAQPSHQQSVTNSSPPYRHQRHPSTTSLIVLSQNNPVSSVSKNRAVSMLQKLIADAENNPNVYTEESHSGVASETHLYGVEACQMNDVVDVNCLIELVNSQMVLCGTETPGYVIVSAAHTEIRQSTHLPVWKNRTLLSKTTWTGSLKCMQYYATVDGNSTQSSSARNNFTSESDIQWLDPDNIDSKSVINDYPDLVGSGHSVGGVVSPIVGKLGASYGDEDSGPIQLQRIISRCNCLFYYAGHTEGVPDDLQHLIPPLPDDDMFIEPWDKEVGVDSFTLTHQDLDISTNSQQYAMIMDIINNLLLFVEPHKKTAFEKLERMQFRFQLSSDEDQREPITQLQDQVRKYVAYLKRLEFERYLVYRASIDDSLSKTVISEEIWNHHFPESDPDFRPDLNTLSYEILKKTLIVKEQLNTASEELAMMISCYKEIQLGAHKAQKQQAASQQGTGAFFASVIKRNEICFKSARWRVTDFDGQLGLADIVLNNFLYSKVVKSDDSVEHTIELGHLHVSNLIPNQAYKDVLHPTELQANIPLDRQRALRVYCRELAPVAGIPVKEHLEVNVVPFTIEVTLQFFQKMVKFFFPEKDSKEELKSKRSAGIDSASENQLTGRFGSKRKKDKGTTNDHLSIAGSIASSSSGSKGSSTPGLSDLALGVDGNNMKIPDDTISTVSTTTMKSNATVASMNSNNRRSEEIEKMRERASKNHTFVYVKIPGIPIKVSYKGKKQKSVTDLKNMSLTLPTYEYHNSTWTWLDLLMAVKNDSKHTVIKQALKQKMKIRPSSIWSKNSNTDQHLPAIETNSKEKSTTPVTDEDKARLLLGQYAKKWRSDQPDSPKWQTESTSSTNSTGSHLSGSMGFSSSAKNRTPDLTDRDVED